MKRGVGRQDLKHQRQGEKYRTITQVFKIRKGIDKMDSENYSHSK
jgi:hypothetical protein